MRNSSRHDLCELLATALDSVTSSVIIELVLFSFS
jgi:hypothetical protein